MKTGIILALATITFYLGTASLIAFVGQLHRHMTAWQEFRSRVEKTESP